MSKLRLIKERADEQEVAADLRGLGETEIMRDSSPHACLVVRDASAGADKQFKGLAAAYGLKVEPGKTSGTFQLLTSVLRAGEHKMQAVTLFVAALEIARAHPRALLLLTEVSRLHQELKNNICHGGKAKHEVLHERVAVWQSSAATASGKKHVLHVDAPVVSHLHQAGFAFARTEHGLDLTDSDLQTHHRFLEGRSSQAAPLRKAA